MHGEYVHHEDVFRAIYQALGISKESLISENKQRRLVYARVIFFHFLCSWYSNVEIARMLNRSHTTISNVVKLRNRLQDECLTWQDQCRRVEECLPNYKQRRENGDVSKLRLWESKALEACRGLSLTELEEMIASRKAVVKSDIVQDLNAQGVAVYE